MNNTFGRLASAAAADSGIATTAASNDTRQSRQTNCSPLRAADDRSHTDKNPIRRGRGSKAGDGIRTHDVSLGKLWADRKTARKRLTAADDTRQGGDSQRRTFCDENT